MPDSAVETKIKAAIAAAADKVAKAETPEEATQWQGIQNQQAANLRAVQDAA